MAYAFVESIGGKFMNRTYTFSVCHIGEFSGYGLLGSETV
jgi:hypothetical protein